MGISVQNLVKTYGSTTVIKDISFEVADGEFVTLLGPSGCGKTTTLRAIAGLDSINSGEIHINNQIVSSERANIFVPPNERNLGMVFQSYAIWPHLTVAQNVAFPLTVRGKKKADEVGNNSVLRLHVRSWETRKSFYLMNLYQISMPACEIVPGLKLAVFSAN
jgi:ABC-type Fe3+/spermidine/putrescine transport system ATPase subunit